MRGLLAPVGGVLPGMQRRLDGYATALTFVEHAVSTAVTPGASNVAGAWTQLIAATAAEAQFVVFSYAATKYANGQTNSVLADLAVGGAGAEVAIASSLCVGGRGPSAATGAAEGITLPLRIPKGSRLSVRLTSDYSTPTNGHVAVALHDRADRQIVSPTALVTNGAVVASSRGTTVGSNDTYVQVTAATAQPYQALVCTVASYDSSTAAVAGRTVTFAVGAAGAETAIATTFGNATTNEEACFGYLPVVGGTFPAGTRIAAKCSDGATNAVSVTVLGVPYA